MKYFIITVDTEGDNLWRYKDGETIGTRNAKYIPRFQSLCEKYGFKPVYLTNYEMAQSDEFIREAKAWLTKGTCEIGVHLHAWNNPPYHSLKGTYSGNPYLIEYPEDVMRAKFKVIYDLIVDRFGVKPISHRAGRWAMDDRYFSILKEFDIKIDCSYTPGIDWGGCKGITCGGSDYSYETDEVRDVHGILEVPATIRKFRNFGNGSFKHRIKSLLTGEYVWLRPASSSASCMKRVLDMVEKEGKQDYVEFMLHSSELMPDGSPYFIDEKSIEAEYQAIEEVFKYAVHLGYTGCTLAEYYQKRTNEL